jgi:hypothetical protein
LICVIPRITLLAPLSSKVIGYLSTFNVGVSL